jgi:hypothetical protein
MSWDLAFAEPIVLANGRELATLREAISHLGKIIPQSEHDMKEVRVAAHCLTQAAEHGGLRYQRSRRQSRRQQANRRGAVL